MKDKKMIILIVAIILMIIGLSIAKSNKPKPVDWARTFYNTQTNPYGTYITYNLLEDIFEQDIRTTRVPIYNNLKKDVDKYRSPDRYYDTDFSEIENLTDTTSFIFVNDRFFLDELDLEYLLDFAGIGNNVFISSTEFDHILLDTLHITSDVSYFESDTIYQLTAYPKRYNFGNAYGTTKLNTGSCEFPVNVLAKNSRGDTIFVDIKYGRGHIYLHTMPVVFTNINMLKTDKYDFGFRCLSYLPQNNNIIWDEYQKQGPLGDDSIFQMMLSNPPLRLALYLILGGLLIFMIFRAKRTQRIIPVINPPVNSSLEFLGTISNLYYKKKDFGTIVEKRHAYLLDFIRKHYYMSTENIDDDFVSRLSTKSGADKDKLADMFFIYKDISTLAFIPNEKFLKYNSLLEEFYNKVQTNR